MARMIFTVSDQMERQIKRVAKDRNMPVSALIREAIQKHLAALGENVDMGVSWGGSRESSEDKDN